MRGRTAPTLITTSRSSRGAEIDAKRRTYLITMGVRTVSFIGAVFLFHGPARVVAILLALVLPWVAVVVANAATPERWERPSLFAPDGRNELHDGAPPHPPAD